VASLKRTELAKGDAIGILVRDDSGHLETEKVGAHSTEKGAGIGLLLQTELTGDRQRVGVLTQDRATGPITAHLTPTPGM
jgi:hypothetical protein